MNKYIEKEMLNQKRGLTEQEALLSAQTHGKNVLTPKKKKSFGDVLFNAVFIAMVSSFLAVDMVKILKIGKTNSEGAAYTPMETFIPLIVIAVTFLSMFVCDILEKKLKQKWLSSFALGLSMLVGMASAVLVNYLVAIG